MVATLRVVLDQVATVVDADVRAASLSLARALVRTAPRGCDVSAIVPAGDADAAGAAVPGLADIDRAPMPRRELAASWQLGLAPGIGGGMIHAPSLMAPLVRHDRVHDHDQTVVTAWDLTAWEDPSRLGKTTVAWQKAMLKRAAKHADAVVVPTHSMGEWLQEHTKLGGRVRIISGAVSDAFAVPSDDVGRRRVLDLPSGFVLVHGTGDELAHAFAALAAHDDDLPIVVSGVAEGQEPSVAEAAVAAGLPAARVHVVGPLDNADRAAVLGGAVALLAPSVVSAFPWRVLEALHVGVPVIAADSPVHREVIVDGGVLADASDPEALADAVSRALGSTAALDRLRVLAADRGRAFAWSDTAERVWQLHAEL